MYATLSQDIPDSLLGKKVIVHCQVTQFIFRCIDPVAITEMERGDNIETNYRKIDCNSVYVVICTVAEAVSRRLTTATALVPCQVRSWGI
jgi:hypothetical protein